MYFTELASVEISSQAEKVKVRESNSLPNEDVIDKP